MSEVDNVSLCCSKKNSTILAELGHFDALFLLLTEVRNSPAWADHLVRETLNFEYNCTL